MQMMNMETFIHKVWNMKIKGEKYRIKINGEINIIKILPHIFSCGFIIHIFVNFFCILQIKQILTEPLIL